MASDPKRGRRDSKKLPPDLSELMTTFSKHATSFIEDFRTKRPEMNEIVEELKKIADEVRQVQQETNKTRKEGAAAGRIQLAVGVLAAPFTEGQSLAGAVVAANITKIRKEKGSVKKVEQLGEDFMKIVEPLKNDLEEIKMTCGKMEQIKTKDEASGTLSDVEKFRTILRRVSELAETSEEALTVVASVMVFIQNLVMLIVSVFRVTATPEEDKKLTDTIIQSADQLEKVILKFDRMMKELEAVTVELRA